MSIYGTELKEQNPVRTSTITTIRSIVGRGRFLGLKLSSTSYILGLLYAAIFLLNQRGPHLHVTWIFFWK